MNVGMTSLYPFTLSLPGLRKNKFKGPGTSLTCPSNRKKPMGLGGIEKK